MSKRHEHEARGVKAGDEQIKDMYQRLGSVWQVGKALNMSGQSVHKRLQMLGVETSSKSKWLDWEVEYLQKHYCDFAGSGRLQGLADHLGRCKTNVCRKARSLGLTDQRRPKPYMSEVISRRMKNMFLSDPMRAKGLSERAKKWIANNGHPRGFSGKTHTEESRRIMGDKSVAWWESLGEDEKEKIKDVQMRTKVEKYGSVANRVPRGTWKAGWRDIGGRRNFYRSRWEANYARYLQWLQELGEIKSWEHEPETFWFEAIKRGVRSYLPDFLVHENTGEIAYHEVKGWMDQRSRTTISRFRKYYPQHKLLVIDGKQYKAISRKVAGIIEGWE